MISVKSQLDYFEPHTRFQLQHEGIFGRIKVGRLNIYVVIYIRSPKAHRISGRAVGEKFSYYLFEPLSNYESILYDAYIATSSNVAVNSEDCMYYSHDATLYHFTTKIYVVIRHTAQHFAYFKDTESLDSLYQLFVKPSYWLFSVPYEAGGII